MILTVHCRPAEGGMFPETVEAQERLGKLLITGTASHLNHVPDTTCHIGDRRAPAGMRVAYITTKQDESFGKEAS
jgi:hypothetical protein